jgi:uncharacterized protein YqgC (DUF456 family)
LGFRNYSVNYYHHFGTGLVDSSKRDKKLEGSLYGIWRTNIGLTTVVFIPLPFRFVLGAFVEASIGELFYGSKNHSRALKVNTGSLLGFLVVDFLVFLASLLFLLLFIKIAWNYKSQLF